MAEKIVGAGSVWSHSSIILYHNNHINGVLLYSPGTSIALTARLARKR